MESCGLANKIHVSADTASLLATAGKGHWLIPREDRIVAKGKGEMQTFWLDPSGGVGRAASTQSGGNTSSSGDDPSSSDVLSAESCLGLGLGDVATSLASAISATTAAAPICNFSGKHNRLVSWNSDILSRLLRHIIARREACGIVADPLEKLVQMEADVGRSLLALSEVSEVIDMPPYDNRCDQVDPSTVTLSHEVTRQLHHYCQTISALYRENSFHNFEVRVRGHCFLLLSCSRKRFLLLSQPILHDSYVVESILTSLNPHNDTMISHTLHCPPFSSTRHM
jgi:hypothetical protein